MLINSRKGNFLRNSLSTVFILSATQELLPPLISAGVYFPYLSKLGIIQAKSIAKAGTYTGYGCCLAVLGPCPHN